MNLTSTLANVTFRSAMTQAATSVLLAFALVACPGLSRGAGAIGGPPAETWIEPTTGMEFILVPGGCYKMGRGPGVEEKLLGEVDQWYLDRNYADETPRHEVCVEPFWLARREVTQGQWETVTGKADQGCEWTGRAKDLPVNFITYEEARDFALGLSEKSTDGSSFRLPTEAEWELACRAGGDTPFSTGWDMDPDDARFFADHGFGTREKYDEPVRSQTVAPVGSYPPNDYGVYDMHGNVAEWTATLYTITPGVEPVFEERDSPRVVKGGSYTNHSRDLRCGARKGAVGRHVSCEIGMRLVRVPPDQPEPSQ